MVEEEEFLICGVCNPLLDIMLPIEDEKLIDEYKLLKGQPMLATETQMPLLEEVTKKEGLMRVPGGAVLTALRAAAVRVSF